MIPTIHDINWAMDIVSELFFLGFEEALTYHRVEYSYGSGWEKGLSTWKSAHIDDLIDLDVVLNSGETKVCLIGECPDNRWVIKIGIDRSPIGSSTNYCESEAENFQLARKAGVDDCFAATYKIGCIGSFPIFLQEFAAADEGEIESECYNYVSSNREAYGLDEIEDEDIEEEAWGRVYDMGDEERVSAMFGDNDRLADFLYSNGINDLHSGNFGISSTGAAKIIDYSGYFG